MGDRNADTDMEQDDELITVLVRGHEQVLLLVIEVRGKTDAGGN
jgi:hypothetical protein